MRASLLVVVAAACNGSGQARTDGRIDGHVDAYQIPATITIHGAARDPATSFTQQSAVAGATITVFVLPDTTTPAATATTDASGRFVATVSTGGQRLQLDIVASAPSHVDTHSFAAVVSDIYPTLDMLTTAEYAAAYTTTGVTQTSGTGMIELDAIGYYAAHASFAAQPNGVVKYAPFGTLDANATSTDDSGRAFVLDAPPPTVTITPMWSSGGGTANASIPVFAGALTIAAIESPFGGD